MTIRVLSVPAEDAEEISKALAMQLAANLGLTYHPTLGCPGHNDKTGVLAPERPGSTHLVDWELESDTEPGMVGLIVKDVAGVDMAALEGTTVQGVALPVGKDVPASWFKRPDVADAVAKGPK